MNKSKAKVSPTAGAVATATVVATRTLTSSTITTTMTSKDIPKVYPQTLDIPSTPSKAATPAKPIHEGDKRSSTTVTSVSPKTAPQPPFVHPDNGSKGLNHQQKSPAAIHPSQFASICREVAQIRDEHVAIRKNLSERENELGKTRVALRNIAEERDSLRNKVSELEHLLKHSPEMYSHVASMLSNGVSTPIKSQKSSPLQKSSSKSSHAFIPTNTSNEPTNFISSPRLTLRNIVTHQQNQKLAGARPDA
ncbi:Usher syndrome type-1C protein-binding protein 1, partial [Orchesella cincta]